MKCKLHLNFLSKPEENNFAQRFPSVSLANQAPAIFHNRLERYPRKQGYSGRSANSHLVSCVPLQTIYSQRKLNIKFSFPKWPTGWEGRKQRKPALFSKVCWTLVVKPTTSSRLLRHYFAYWTLALHQTFAAQKTLYIEDKAPKQNILYCLCVRSEWILLQYLLWSVCCWELVQLLWKCQVPKRAIISASTAKMTPLSTVNWLIPAL